MNGVEFNSLLLSRYWHRPLNPRKLVDVGFLPLWGTMTLEWTIELYCLPEENSLPGFRVLEDRDLPACRKLLSEYLEKQAKLYPIFSEEEFAHWLVLVGFSFEVAECAALTFAYSPPRVSPTFILNRFEFYFNV